MDSPSENGSTDRAAEVEYPAWPDWPLLAAIAVTTSVLAFILYPAPLPGTDWVLWFSRRAIDAYYPPWVTLLLRPLTDLPMRTGLAIINALTLSTVSLLSYRLSRISFPDTRLPALTASLMVLCTPATWMVLWPGQIESLVLLGVIGLPVGVPLLFAKPHMGPFVALRSRRDLMWLTLIVAVSLLLWWMWPLEQYEFLVARRVGVPSSIGWTSTHPIVAVLGVVLLILSSRNVWQLMAAGLFISPFVQPYHYYLLLPSLAEVKGYRRMALWLTSWLALIGQGAYKIEVKFLVLIYPLLVWALLAPSLHPRQILADPDIILNRAIRTAREAVGWVRRRPESLPSKTR